MNCFLLSRLSAGCGVGCSSSFNQFINKMQWMHFRFFDDRIFIWEGLSPQALMMRRHCSRLNGTGNVNDRVSPNGRSIYSTLNRACPYYFNVTCKTIIGEWYKFNFWKVPPPCNSDTSYASTARFACEERILPASKRERTLNRSLLLKRPVCRLLSLKCV